MNSKQLVKRLVELNFSSEEIEEKLASRWPQIVNGVLEKMGVSLRALADHLDVSPSYLSQVATGKIQPSPRLIGALASRM